MADENHLIEIQVGETGADQVASKLGQVDSAADKIPSNINIKVTADTSQAQPALAQIQSQAAFVSEQALQQFRQAVSQAAQQSAQLTSRASTPTLPIPPTPAPTPTGPLRPGGPYSPRPWPTPPSPTPAPPSPPTPPITPPSTPTGPGINPPPDPNAIKWKVKESFAPTDPYAPPSSPAKRTLTGSGFIDPSTGLPTTKSFQEITDAQRVLQAEKDLREDRRRMYQSSDTEQYRARRLDPVTGKPVSDMIGAKAQLDLVNKELASMGGTTGMTSQQLDRYNTLLKRQADLSVDAAGKTRNFGSDLMKHAGYVAYAALIWTTFRSVSQTLDEIIVKQREYSLETTRFAAITQQSVGSAMEQWNRLSEIGTQSGVAPSQMGRTILIAQQMGAGRPEAQEQFAATSARLNELTGVETSKISESISSYLRQANEPLEKASRVGDLIANALQRIPAAEFNDVISALQEAPALMELWGTSSEEAFNIIIEGASRAQESPEQVATAFQRLSQGLNEIAQGGEKAWTRQRTLMSEFGLQALDASGRLRTIPDILRDAAEILPTLSAPRQQEFLNVIAGGSIKPDQLRTIVGGIKAFTVDLDGAISGLDGTLQEMTDVIDKSLGQSVKVLDAKIEQLRQRGDLVSNLLSSLLRGTLAEWGGAEGVKATENIVESGNAAVRGQSDRSGFIQNIIDQSGGDLEEAKRLAKEHNQQVESALRNEIQWQINPLASNAARSYAVGLLISDEMIAEALKEGAQKILEASSSRQSVLGAIAGLGFGAGEGLVPPVSPIQVPPTVDQSNLPQDFFSTRARGVMLNAESGLTGESVLPTQMVDMTKYSMDEINQARQLSIQLSMQELEVMRLQLDSMGFTKDQVDGIVAKRKEELDTAILLLRTQQGLSYEIGISAEKMQEALSQMDKQKSESSSLFQFRRLKDVDPSQFGQLQSLTKMYDQFLSNIGSPEKQMNINLLLGEQNTFKTMNARMTALQLALEDLTKVEKAQLSGTWNLPAGATALVPISSLDIQRWNKSDSGGLSPEAIAALLGVEGATTQSGDKVTTAVDNSARSIVAAINAGFFPDIHEEQAKVNYEEKNTDAINSMPDFLEELARANYKPTAPDQSRITGGYRDMEEYRSLLRDAEQYPGEFKSSDPAFRQQQTTVNVAPLPLRANFTANLAVQLDGRTVARMLFPFFYQELIKMSSTTPTAGGGVGAIR